MTVTKRSILGAANPFDDKQPSPMTTPGSEPSASTIGTSKHGDEAAFNSAKARALGEKPGGSAGFALEAGDFRSAGYNGSDAPSETSEYGKGIAGEAPLSTSKYNGSDTPSETSEYGKTVG